MASGFTRNVQSLWSVVDLSNFFTEIVCSLIEICVLLLHSDDVRIILCNCLWVLQHISWKCSSVSTGAMHCRWIFQTHEIQAFRFDSKRFALAQLSRGSGTFYSIYGLPCSPSKNDRVTYVLTYSCGFAVFCKHYQVSQIRTGRNRLLTPFWSTHRFKMIFKIVVQTATIIFRDLMWMHVWYSDIFWTKVSGTALSSYGYINHILATLS